MFWRDPGRKLVTNLAAYRRHRDAGGALAWFGCRLAKARHIFWTHVTASDINREADIDESTMLPHPNGIVIHGEAVIGAGCMIMQQVTIGQIGEGAPRISGNVYIGAGAKVLGRISIGEGARIGANAVVLTDVPPGATAVGVPARIIPARGEAAAEG